MKPFTLEEVKEQFDSLPPNTYTLVTSFYEGRHRGKEMLAVVSPEFVNYKIDGMSCAVATIVGEPGWLIVANFYGDDHRFTDIGPFSTLSEAITYVLLRKDTGESRE